MSAESNAKLSQSGGHHKIVPQEGSPERPKESLTFSEENEAQHDASSVSLSPQTKTFAGVLENYSAWTELVYTKPFSASSTTNIQNTDTEDTATLISETFSIAPPTKATYVSEIVTDIIKRTQFDGTNDLDMGRVYAVLPQVLKAFALRLEHVVQDVEHRNIMVFIYKYRNDIIEDLKRELSTSEIARTGEMSVEEKMNRYFDAIDVEAPNPPAEDIAVDDDGGNGDEGTYAEDTDIKELLIYRSLIFKNSAYQWLIGTLLREYHLNSSESKCMEAIRSEILRALPKSSKISRYESADAYEVKYRINWDPFTFLAEQSYDVEPPDAIENAITLTGSLHDAQALPCLGYLSQTWPSTGQTVMQLIKDVIAGERGHQYSRHLPDRTKLTAWTSGPNFFVKVSGTSDSVAETGEQFAWIGAALRSSPFEAGIAYATPRIDSIQDDGFSDRPTEVVVKARIAVDLDYDVHQYTKLPDEIGCQCWHDMFESPVIVPGYPIPRRPEWNTGLDVPLDMMAGLVNTRRINFFKDKLFIKGHTSMLVPTKSVGKMLIWHFIQRQDNTRISYTDNHGFHASNIDIVDLQGFKHVVGWCSDAKTFAGASEAIYTVTEPRDAPNATADCKLYGAVLRQGALIPQGKAYAMGTRDMRRAFLQHPVQRHKFISEKLVVLWDEKEKRGWLINGTTAILHLVRASLHHSDTSNFSHRFPPISQRIVEAKLPYRAESATDVLHNELNKRLEIYPSSPGTTGASDGARPLFLGDRIESFYDTLEIMIDHQIESTIRSTQKSNEAQPNRLEGWRFVDLAHEKDPVHPCMSKPRRVCRGWEVLVQSTYAVTLFGRGFGDMILPDKECQLCPYWKRLPSNQHYLAALVSDLKLIMTPGGKQHNNNPRILNKDIAWHESSETFMTCVCSSAQTARHLDLVQVLQPRDLQQTFARSSLMKLHGKGAVLFGRSQRLLDRVLDKSAHDSLMLDTTEDSDQDSESLPESEVTESSTERSLCENNLGLSHTPLVQCKSTYKNPSGLPVRKATLSYQPELRKDFHIAIICALLVEVDAVEALFDGYWEDRGIDCGRSANDENSYSTGWIHGHNVVLVKCTNMGKVDAANVSGKLKQSFPNIELGLVVGICGAVPFFGDEREEILLGDIIISTGLVQYDLGRQHETHFATKRSYEDDLKRPDHKILSFLNKQRSYQGRQRLYQLLSAFMQELAEKEGFQQSRYPGAKQDKLYDTSYVHRHRVPEDCATCADDAGVGLSICEDARTSKCRDLGCDTGRLILRRRFENIQENHGVEQPYASLKQHAFSPKVHFGNMASGDTIMKSGKERDRIATTLNAIGFEMEGAGAWNNLPTVVVKGVCDYADSHKNDDWHRYAADTAAACMKALLYTWQGPPENPDSGSPSNKRRRR